MKADGCISPAYLPVGRLQRGGGGEAGAPCTMLHGVGDDQGREEQGPLAGVRVLELGSFIAGPFSGQLLGDYGAEIIKIEPGEGDPMRRRGITREGDSLWWPAIGRNKRSVTLDLRDERARVVVRRLAAACDVVIENFRPGRLDEWGLGYDVLAAANPAV